MCLVLIRVNLGTFGLVSLAESIAVNLGKRESTLFPFFVRFLTIDRQNVHQLQFFMIAVFANACYSSSSLSMQLAYLIQIGRYLN
jgi:hypothetical protein